ncbi:DUF4393 domain-containing protein [Haloechinothrix sp. YIM 98757]|uniref:DUF4393 domain-containing protein n=1 Tax=Haloechinothrix aidingensis TaxID=2752311 RepID=A0A837ZVX3_9PSEU|nr:Abi-alpha family protein [Haloechinothrix aidingensis]MBA0124806.1 DUF4393 domain-containing protein [Haloechinothrix aidingensis]
MRRYDTARGARNADASLIDAAPGLAKLAATGCARLVTWAVDTTVQTGTRAVASAVNGAAPSRLAQDAASELVVRTRKALESSGEGQVQKLPGRSVSVHCSPEELRSRGAELLYRSADVRCTEGMHPAYERILDEIAPDEARILRLLAVRGAQPTVDVRTGRPFGVGSELVAERMSMIGQESGCRYVERTGAYLNNLFRLGLVWFSSEKVEPGRYQVVEVQPAVIEAMRRAGRSASTVHGSVHLTAFGLDFCSVCLPLDGPVRS